MIERPGIPNAGEILGRYPSKRSALMPLLYEVQERDGFVTEAGMEEVAEHIGLTPAEVFGVCSFYSMFKRSPQGRLLVSVCTSVSCMVNGGEELFASLRDRYADDPDVTVEEVECLAADDPTLARPLPETGLRTRVETRLDPATAGWARGAPGGEPVLRAWVRLADGRAPDPLALLLFADVLPPTSWAIGHVGWAPTVQLQALVRALPAPGWCLVEARAGEVAGGWLDEDYRIWDADGRLVAQSRQLARLPR